MSTTALVVSLILGALVALSGVATAAGMPQVVNNILAVGWPKERLWVLALCKVAAGAGLIVGMSYAPVGLAAAIGLVFYFGGALVFHHQAKNKQIAPAVVYLAMSTAAVVLIGLAI